MTPTAADLAIMQGDDWAAVVTVTNADGTTADLTGHSAQASIRLGLAEHFPALYTIATSITLPNTITLVIASDTTSQLYCEYRWDLQIIDQQGRISTLLLGRVFTTQQVTT
jgi:hypothetical protein